MLEVLYDSNSDSLHALLAYLNMDELINGDRPGKGVICQALFEAHIPVSLVAMTAKRQNVCGCIFPASGIWGIFTRPGAWRMG